jgi:hypothetical protein
VTSRPPRPGSTPFHSSVERDDEPADQPVLRRQQHFAGGHVGLGEPRVARLDPAVRAPPLEDAQLVVGRLLPIRRGDRLLADERSDRDAPELHYGTVREAFEHRLPVTAAHTRVEALDVLVQQVSHGRGV